jgi:predicted DNA-binding transcriptional regulator YafY
MPRGDQLARQWKIIQTLITSRRGKSAAELAEGLECHPRTLYRDLEALQVAGFPIYTEKVEGKNLWSLLDTLKHNIPIPDAAGYFKEKIWHDTQEIISQKDGSIIFEAEVAGTEEIKFWVMSWGSKAEVLEPQSLREEIRAESEALLGKCGGDLLSEEKPSVA